MWRKLVVTSMRVLLIVAYHLLAAGLLNIRIEHFTRHAAGLLMSYLLPLTLLALTAHLYFIHSSRKRKAAWLVGSTVPSTILLYRITGGYDSLEEQALFIFDRYSIEMGIWFPFMYLVIQFVLLLAWLAEWRSQRDGTSYN
ncbi:hypothetical protein [Paenibacillus tepidiphilus]|uniref:hypothetical protein n=1 Tax=Paenibacillus tepidiphilus TaxID=2608683 RepID=UPI00123C6B91|nr:hypothetical protein [Paenibacillus tepidiphilus]